MLTMGSTYRAWGQIVYDNGPVIISDSSSSHFVIYGNKWSSNRITFYFKNGTDDISGNLERGAVRRAFKLWECVTPLTFSEADSAASADIVILWASGDHGDSEPFDNANNILAHAFQPPPYGKYAGDIHFDDAETWSLSTRATTAQPIDLETIAAHEIGHSLGLLHSENKDALMYGWYSGSHKFLHIDDIKGIQKIYGANPNANSGFSAISALCQSSSQTITYSHPYASSIVVSSWSASSNVSIVSSNSSSVTIRARNSSSSGEGWVKAVLNTGIVLTRRFNVKNNAPSANNLTLTATSVYGCQWTRISAYYKGAIDGGTSGYTWHWSASGLWMRGNGKAVSNVYVKPINSSMGSVYIQVRGKNRCGDYGGWKGKWFSVEPCSSAASSSGSGSSSSNNANNSGGYDIP